jgi:hypothetical protein
MSNVSSGLKIGDLTLEKGIVRKDVSMFAWDGVQMCDPDICAVVDRCGYIKRGKCAVQMKYLEALYNAILGTYKYMDDVMLFKIGMQIIPLYVQLVKMQMLELSLTSPIYTTDKGAVLPHPVYKEIRETLKTIYTMWKDLDLSFTFNAKPEFKRPSSSETGSGDDVNGDPNYYKRMTSDNGSMKGVIR